MKRNLVSLVSLVTLVSLVSLTSCNKEERGDGSQFYGTMEQCADQHSKTVLNDGVLSWTAGDQVAIYGTAGSGLYTAQPQSPATNAVFNNVSGRSGEAPYYAIYPATISTAANAVTLPATQVTEDGSLTGYPMYAESADNHLAFKNLCGLLKLNLTKANTSISSITVTASSEINGNYTVNYNGGNPTLAYVSGGSSTTTLTCTTAQAIDNGKDFYIYLPAGSYTSLNIAISNSLGQTCTKSTKAGVTVNVYRSQYTTINLGENDLVFPPIGSKGGLFTINGDGDQVWFSQGNLQYQASTNTWRFAENQYDYVGADNSNISATYSGWIDLFGWGTGSNPTLASTDVADYTTFVDWGMNAISNGGNTANSGWHTLSQTEWNHLLYNRGSSKRGNAMVNGVNGKVLLPDSWTMPTGLPAFNTTQSDWNDNVYTLSQWAEMEANGAVFLPAAGYRMSVMLEGVNYYGHYWMHNTPRFASVYTYNLELLPESYIINAAMWLYCGVSVRLVKDEN